MNNSLILGGGIGALILLILSGNKSSGSNTPQIDPDKPKELKPDDLIIAPDCTSFAFGDKTGDAWWTKNGRPVAAEWINQNYKNPLSISMNMLSSLTPCLNTYPKAKDFANRRDLEIARARWVKDHRPIWNLAYKVRNFIDVDFFNGSTTVRINPDTLTVGYGAGFDKEKFWTLIKPIASAILYEENPEMEGKEWKPWSETVWSGVVADGIMKGEGKPSGWYDFVKGSLNYVFYMIFSNLSNADFVKLYQKNTVLSDNNAVYKDVRKKLEVVYQDYDCRIEKKCGDSYTNPASYAPEVS